MTTTRCEVCGTSTDDAPVCPPCFTAGARWAAENHVAMRLIGLTGEEARRQLEEVTNHAH